MHVTIDELVDIAEGARPESAAPHLAGCEPCRAQLREVRAMMSAARDADVPEPSPLFWDHLSARVSEAVAEDTRLKGSRSFDGDSRSFVDRLTALLGARTFQASVAVAAALLIAVVLGSRSATPVRVSTPVARVVLGSDAPAAPELLDDPAAAEDAALTLVAILTDAADLETKREAGLTSRGSAEHAVTHLSDGELRELRRLLKQEMTKKG